MSMEVVEFLASIDVWVYVLVGFVIGTVKGIYGKKKK